MELHTAASEQSRLLGFTLVGRLRVFQVKKLYELSILYSTHTQNKMLQPSNTRGFHDVVRKARGNKLSLLQTGFFFFSLPLSDKS